MRLPIVPSIVFLSLAANGFLIGLVVMLLQRSADFSLSNSVPAAVASPVKTNTAAPTAGSGLGPRHQLNYRQWVDLLRQEAAIAASKQSPSLTILLGDSLSLWFPAHLLSADRTWLNQGISGETTAGLINRLELLDDTEPETIFLMIGINDLLRNVEDQTILRNQRRIIRYLKDQHPTANIVVQSILPHSADNATWEGRDRLLAVSNQRIQSVNKELEAIAREESVYFLNLYPLFADGQGQLRPNLSTDGLHLNPQGYLVWHTALELYSQVTLDAQ